MDVTPVGKNILVSHSSSKAPSGISKSSGCSTSLRTRVLNQLRILIDKKYTGLFGHYIFFTSSYLFDFLLCHSKILDHCCDESHLLLQMEMCALICLNTLDFWNQKFQLSLLELRLSQPLTPELILTANSRLASLIIDQLDVLNVYHYLVGVEYFSRSTAQLSTLVALLFPFDGSMIPETARRLLEIQRFYLGQYDLSDETIKFFMNIYHQYQQQKTNLIGLEHLEDQLTEIKLNIEIQQSRRDTQAQMVPMFSNQISQDEINILGTSPVLLAFD